MEATSLLSLRFTPSFQTRGTGGLARRYPGGTACSSICATVLRSTPNWRAAVPGYTSTEYISRPQLVRLGHKMRTLTPRRSHHPTDSADHFVSGMHRGSNHEPAPVTGSLARSVLAERTTQPSARRRRPTCPPPGGEEALFAPIPCPTRTNCAGSFRPGRPVVRRAHREVPRSEPRCGRPLASAMDGVADGTD